MLALVRLGCPLSHAGTRQNAKGWLCFTFRCALKPCSVHSCQPTNLALFSCSVQLEKVERIRNRERILEGTHEPTRENFAVFRSALTLLKYLVFQETTSQGFKHLTMRAYDYACGSYFNYMPCHVQIFNETSYAPGRTSEQIGSIF
jgi:hypothetical protein